MKPVTAIAAELSPTSEALAARIPPELFKNILAYVRDEVRLADYDIFDITSPEYVSAVAARRDEMRHLSACALTYDYVRY